MGDTPQVVVFCFAGRRDNMRLQVPMMQRVLESHPNVEYHVWNLTRRKDDSRYLHQLEPYERMTVRHDFDGVRPWRDNLGNVWRHYTDKRYKNSLFVKLDDDIVFLETARFGEYIDTVDANRGSVVSANVINNGACSRVQPGIWARYEPRSPLDAHRYIKFAELAHSWFFGNWRDIVGEEITVVPTEDWLSINAVGMDYPTLCEVAGRFGRPSPRIISGRPFPMGTAIGDEGAVNMGPRMIMRGFTVAHLGFGPQLITEQQFAQWRRHYDKIGRQYLADHATKVLV